MALSLRLELHGWLPQNCKRQFHFTEAAWHLEAVGEFQRLWEGRATWCNWPSGFLWDSLQAFDLVLWISWRQHIWHQLLTAIANQHCCLEIGAPYQLHLRWALPARRALESPRSPARRGRPRRPNKMEISSYDMLWWGFSWYFDGIFW